jgi:hypothetical protein
VDLIDILATITGVVGAISAVGGVLLAIRALRSKERKAAEAELKDVTGMLDDERRERIEAERRNHQLNVLLAQHGIDPPNGQDHGRSGEDLP